VTAAVDFTNRANTVWGEGMGLRTTSVLTRVRITKLHFGQWTEQLDTFVNCIKPSGYFMYRQV
jgi:hypothetical protein